MHYLYPPPPLCFRTKLVDIFKQIPRDRYEVVADKMAADCDRGHDEQLLCARELLTSQERVNLMRCKQTVVKCFLHRNFLRGRNIDQSGASKFDAM